eukprot:1184681-Pyramimonas_sp.AAC.1
MRRRRTLITEMVGNDGTNHTTRQGIAHVFATFYEELYKSTDTVDAAPSTTDAHQHITPFTVKELDAAISQLKLGKSWDTEGITAEMLKKPCLELQDALLQLYSTVFKPNAPTPASWRKTSITVIPKSGDLSLPQNYRPICAIPTLYILFN